jgi:3-hydroxyisobutyrate dehydrogenase-like beta-hydroxyacid dehydrogenase
LKQEMDKARKMRIGFVGLGSMGTPMCKHIRAAGHDVTAFVRSDAGREKAASIDAKAARTIAGLADAADLVLSAVTDDSALLDIVAGPDGLAAHMPRGSIFVDTSTVSPKASERAASLMEAAGIGYLRSPVSGSTATAEAKKLTVLASGPRKVFDRALPVLQTFSAKQYHVGEGGEARYLKLALNALVGATSALVSEALAIGRSGGLDMAAMLEVINNSAVASPLISYKTRMMLDDDYTPAFPVTGMMKDLDLALAVARDGHVPVYALSAVRQSFESAFADGDGDHDFFVLVKRLASMRRVKDDG